MTEVPRLLAVAEETAVSAGQLIRHKSSQPRQLTEKGFRDIVTDADLASQELIVATIQQNFPTHGFLPEETDSNLPTEGDVIWVIDPVDGTTNYSRQLPNFTVSIAALDPITGDVLVGAICDPMREELFSAAKGQGAWVNKHPISASNVSHLVKAIASMDMSHAYDVRQRSLDTLNNFGHHVYSIRVIGSAALAMAWVAAGRVDAYLNYQLKPWDVAAAQLILAEAGGQLTTTENRPWLWTMAKSGIVATNRHIHADFVAMLV
ncbi:MAG: inositol monophosphatase family protein [Chloroflexota bacterium]